MLPEILQFPDPILLTKCEVVIEFGTQELKDLAVMMFSVTDKAKAAGLAANQIGINKAIFVGYFNSKRIVCINPEILKSSGSSIAAEGCLSKNGGLFFKEIERPLNILFQYKDLYGTTKKKAVSGFAARLVSHEVDHLNGVSVFV